MKKLVFVLPVIIFGLLAVFLYTNLGKDSEHLESQFIGKPLPAFQLQNLQGEAISQADIQGPALLNVWASWCPACAAEHDILMGLKQQGIKIYGLNYKDEQADALKFLSTLGNPFYKIIVDPEGHYGFDLGVYGAPETFFIDAQGNVQYRHVGEIYPALWKEKLQPIYDSM